MGEKYVLTKDLSLVPKPIADSSKPPPLTSAPKNPTVSSDLHSNHTQVVEVEASNFLQEKLPALEVKENFFN